MVNQIQFINCIEDVIEYFANPDCTLLHALDEDQALDLSSYLKNPLYLHTLKKCSKKLPHETQRALRPVLSLELCFPIYKKIGRIVFGILIFPIIYLMPTSWLPYSWGLDKLYLFRRIVKIKFVVLMYAFTGGVKNFIKQFQSKLEICILIP